MFAVVEIAGKQFKVSPKDTILVPTLKEKAGATLTFDRVLLVGSDRETRVGNPIVAGAKVQGTVVDHGRGEKVTVFKKKKRKGYRVKRGHRQGYTRVEITSIA
jgi:large subunit ribosomal protein L21